MRAPGLYLAVTVLLASYAALAAQTVDFSAVRQAFTPYLDPLPPFVRGLRPRPRQAPNKTIEECAVICDNAYDIGSVNKFLSCGVQDELICQCQSSESLSSSCLGCVLLVVDAGFTPVEWFRACKLIPPAGESCDVICTSSGDKAAIAALSTAGEDPAAICGAFSLFSTLECPDCALAALASPPGTAQDVIIACAEGGYFKPGSTVSSAVASGSTLAGLGGITAVPGLGNLPSASVNNLTVLFSSSTTSSSTRTSSTPSTSPPSTSSAASSSSTSAVSSQGVTSGAGAAYQGGLGAVALLSALVALVL